MIIVPSKEVLKMKGKETEYDYGECKICNTFMQEKYINQNFWIRGELIIVEDVPAWICPQCGEKVAKVNVGRWIAKLLENTKRIAETPKISVPAIKFDREETKV